MKATEIKSNLHKMIDSIEDNRLLQAIHSLISKLTQKKEPVDFWDTLSDEEKISIEEGLKDIEEGRLIPHEEVMREFRSRYGL